MVELSPEQEPQQQKSYDITAAELTAYLMGGSYLEGNDTPRGLEPEKFILNNLGDLAASKGREPLYALIGDNYSAYEPNPETDPRIMVFDPRHFEAFLKSEKGKSQTEEYINLINNYDRLREEIDLHRDQLDNGAGPVEIIDPDTGVPLVLSSTRFKHFKSDPIMAKLLSSNLAVSPSEIAKIVGASYEDNIIISERPDGTEVSTLGAEDIDNISTSHLEGYVLFQKALREVGLVPSELLQSVYYDPEKGFSILFVEPGDDWYSLHKPPVASGANGIKIVGRTAPRENEDAGLELDRARKGLKDRYTAVVGRIYSDDSEDLY